MTHLGLPSSLLVFAKPPLPGVSKTRLARTAGCAQAARIARRLQAHTLHVARRTVGTRCVLWVSPKSALTLALPGVWPAVAGMKRSLQGAGDLGARLTGAFRASPNGHVVVVGTDCPDLAPRHIKAAFDALKSHEVVVGPAEDGGFWLFGCRKRQGWRSPFASVRWSSQYALADVLAALPATCRIAQLETLADIDDAADLANWGGRSGHRLGGRR